MFDVFAPNSTFPYTYDGLCDAIRDYNKDHTEKVFQMGSEDLIRKEIAAFLGNTAHESDDFEAGREYLACGDRKEVDGKVYCKPCTNDLYDWENNECSVSMVDQNAPYNSYCQPGFEPPEGCVCDTITQVEETGPLAGYVEASKVFYGRGAIQLSWNYNYIRASFALTGEADTFCNDPEQVVLSPVYAWGTAIFFWMESQKEGTTCHKEALNRDFGGTLNVINGGLECPAYKGGWHHDAIKMRINRYCHAAVLLGIDKLSSFGGCKGLTDSFEECLGDGWCPHCEQYAEIPTEESGFTSVEIEDNGSSEEVTDTAEEDAKTSVPTADPTSSNPEPSPPPTILFSKTKSPTMSPSTKTSSVDTGTPTLALETGTPTLEPSSASVLVTDTPTLKPTNDPSSSPVTTSPTLAPTEPQPTYMPTTPQPTMGPCSGEACPDGLCRSAWGFCGNAEGYCNDSAIWSPSCPPATVTAPSPPSPQMTNVPAPPTKSPIGTSTLNDVFGVSDQTDEGEELPLPPTSQPTIPISSGPKPTGGKEPGGKPKPTINSPTTLEPSTSPTPLPTSLPTPASPPTQNPSKESESYEDFANLSYPENTFFCGRTWEQVNDSCSLRCPSSKSADCPEGLSCFAFTQCNDKLAGDATTDSMDSQSDGSGESTALDSQSDGLDESTASDSQSDGSGEAIATDVIPAPEEETSSQEGCTGAPCPFENECRSEYGFCGTSFIYCNMLSSWTLEKCGLLGIDANGETQLCDVEVFECATGEAVHRNPAEGCEYFPCPSVEEEGAVLSSAFSVPAPSPLPPLAKPTLPTITKPSASHSSSAFLPTSSTSTSASDSSNSLAILLGDNNEDEVVDDTDKQEDEDVEEEEPESTTDATTKPISASYDFGSFKADEWLFSNSAQSRYDWTCQLLVSLFTVVQLLIIYN
jgi:hypothetical protein